MSWVEHPKPDEADSETGQRILSSSLTRNGGRLGMYAAMFTFPEVGEAMAQVFQRAHFGRTALSNLHKEMLAVLVSSNNRCQY